MLAQRRVWLVLAGVLVLYAVLRLALGPLAQNTAYHALADTRSVGLIPRAGDVLSNLAILGAGLFGLALRKRMTLAPEERAAADMLIVAAILTAFGSAYYHWAPSNATLVWDRLPIALILTSLFALVLGDRVHPLYTRHALWPLTLLGAAAVVLWALTETMGHGDLWLYLIVRVGAGFAIAALIVFRRGRYTGTRWLVAAIAAEIAMAALERRDHEVFAATGWLASGHNIKHVLAGFALACLFWWLHVRRVRA